MAERHIVATGMLAGAVTAYLALARTWQLRWGATKQECDGPLPGDSLIPSADLSATRAITIHAPADQVWPWIAQLGQGRGGFYSYDVLENLAGCDVHSAARVAPDWQDLVVGDRVRLTPEAGLDVVLLERGRSLVLRGAAPFGGAAPACDFTWAFVLRDDSNEATRLLVRERFGYTRPWAGFLIEPVEAISFLMSRKMLRGIKQRAEPAVVRPGGA